MGGKFAGGKSYNEGMSLKLSSFVEKVNFYFIFLKTTCEDCAIPRIEISPV